MRKTHPLRLRARRNCGYGADLISPSEVQNTVGTEMLKTGRVGILDDGGYWYWDGITVYHATPEKDWIDFTAHTSNANAVATNDLEPSTVRIAATRSALSDYMVNNVYPWYMLGTSGSKKIRDPRPISQFARPGYYTSKGGIGPDFADSLVIVSGNPKGANKYRWDLARAEIVYPNDKKGPLTEDEAKAFHDGGYKGYDYMSYAAGDALLASLGKSSPTSGGGGGGGGGRTKPKRDDVVKPGTVTKPGPTKQLVKEASEARIKPGGGTNWFLPVGLGIAAIGTIVGAVYWRKRKA